MLLINDQGVITHLTLLVLGNQHTGKSELIKSFTRGDPPTNAKGDSIYVSRYIPTIERAATIPVLHQKKAQSSDVEGSNRAITLNLVEIGGHSAYSSILPSCVHAADAFMLVYDVGNCASFESLWTFYRLIHNLKGRKQPIVIVGSMVDTLARSVRQRQVPASAREELGNLLQCQTFETCARAKLAVHNIFHSLIDVSQNIVFEHGVVDILQRQQRLLSGIHSWDRLRHSSGSLKSATSERQSNRYSTISITAHHNNKSEMASNWSGVSSNTATFDSSVSNSGTPLVVRHSLASNPSTANSTKQTQMSASITSCMLPPRLAKPSESSPQRSMSNASGNASTGAASTILAKRNELYEAWLNHKREVSSTSNSANTHATVAELKLRCRTTEGKEPVSKNPSWSQVESSLAANLACLETATPFAPLYGKTQSSCATHSLDALLRDIEDFQKRSSYTSLVDSSSGSGASSAVASPLSDPSTKSLPNMESTEGNKFTLMLDGWSKSASAKKKKLLSAARLKRFSTGNLYEHVATMKKTSNAPNEHRRSAFAGDKQHLSLSLAESSSLIPSRASSSLSSSSSLNSRETLHLSSENPSPRLLTSALLQNVQELRLS